MTTMTGTVCFWNREHAWGFITPTDENQPDCFVHCSGLVGRKFLRKGERVEFEAGERNGRPFAVSVRVIQEVAPAAQGGGDEVKQ